MSCHWVYVIVLYLLLCSPCCLRKNHQDIGGFFKHKINKEIPLCSAKHTFTFQVAKRYHLKPRPTVGMRLNQLRGNPKLLKTKLTQKKQR